MSGGTALLRCVGAIGARTREAEIAQIKADRLEDQIRQARLVAIDEILCEDLPEPRYFEVSVINDGALPIRNIAASLHHDGSPINVPTPRVDRIRANGRGLVTFRPTPELPIPMSMTPDGKADTSWIAEHYTVTIEFTDANDRRWRRRGDDQPERIG